jgi:putative SOS response-associated peptidase YedK
MCGRYSLATPDPFDLRVRFRVPESVEVRRRYNVAPGDEVLTVTERGGELLRWGFLADAPYKTINARAETVAERPAWRAAFQRTRCLVLADGFFEWQQAPGGRKRPHWVTRADGAPFAFAGLWSPRGTCAIVTTEAAPGIAHLHDRMPVMLPGPAEEEAWVDPATPQIVLRDLMAPFGDTHALAVGSAVNDARYDGPECLEPAPPPEPTLF